MTHTAPAASPVGTVAVIVIAVVPTVTADELIVPATARFPTPDSAYSVWVTPISSTGLPPGGTGRLLFCVIWDRPTYTVFRPVFVIRTTFAADVFGVNAHVGVTAGFTELGVPGGKFGTRAIRASSRSC
jgi:hypothetical protein